MCRGTLSWSGPNGLHVARTFWKTLVQWTGRMIVDFGARPTREALGKPMLARSVEFRISERDNLRLCQMPVARMERAARGNFPIGAKIVAALFLSGTSKMTLSPSLISNSQGLGVCLSGGLVTSSCFVSAGDYFSSSLASTFASFLASSLAPSFSASLGDS